jgi:hypothetical protein
MKNWLLFCHAPNNFDYKSIVLQIQKMKKNLHVDTTVYVIIFGPTLRSLVHLVKVQSNVKNEVLSEHNGCDDCQLTITKKMIKKIIELTKIHAICFLVHGSGYVIGNYKTPIHPFLDITDIVKFIIIPLRPKLIVFDACYQASMCSLFELPDFVKVTIGSSALHPYTSMIETKAFCKIPNFTSKNEILRYAHSIVHQWHNLTKDKDKSLLVYDNSYIPKIGSALLRHTKKCLVFDKAFSRLDKSDVNLHDLFIVCRNLPDIQILIKKCIEINCNNCKRSCVNTVNGMSIQKNLPRKWEDRFKKTMWYKKVFKFL